MENSPIEILVFEHDHSQAKTIREMLAESRKPEFSMLNVRSLADGLTLLRDRNFDIILTGLLLPDSQGLETALVLRNQARRTPIIVVTGIDDEEVALKALRSDIQDYLIKGEITGTVLRRSICYAIERQRDSEAQLEWEELFASFMYHLPVAAWMKDRQGRYVQGNAEQERIFSMPFSQYAGKTDEELLPPETARRLRENDARVLATGESLQTVETARLADGIEHHFVVSKFPVSGPDGRTAYVAGIAQDITDRVRAEEALQKSEKKFATVFQEAPALLAISTLKDGRFVDVNEATLRTLGYERDEMIGRSSLEINFWENPSDRAAMLETMEKTGSIKNVEVRIRGRNGQSLIGLYSADYIDVNGDRYLLSLVKDITLKRQAQEQVEQLNAQLTARAAELEQVNQELADDLEAMKLLQSLGMLFLHEGNLEQILSQVLDAAIAISSADFGNIQIINAQTSCLQIAVQQGFPQWWLDFWNRVVEGHGVCGTALKRGERVIVEDIEQSPIFVGTDALEIQRKAGVRAVQSTPLVSRSGSFLGMFSTHYKVPHRPSDRELRLLDLLARHAADFIEHAQLKKTLETRAEELAEANRELEAFNYTVAHDLRNPLNLINGYYQIVMRACGDQLDEECKGYLQQAYQATLRMSKLISALLEFSRLSHSVLHRETLELSAMAQAVAAELRLGAPERSVDFRIGEAIVVEGDRELLRVVLNNLLGNAWKYTAMRDQAIIEFGVTEIDGQATCFVRDNGPGFDPVDAGKLFLPFKRLTETAESKGFGIGLATVERIIRRHGGRIWAEGEPGKGATFWFTLGE